jgi:hypothetical protein
VNLTDLGDFSDFDLHDTNSSQGGGTQDVDRGGAIEYKSQIGL